jgi:hypothetical protein
MFWIYARRIVTFVTNTQFLKKCSSFERICATMGFFHFPIILQLPIASIALISSPNPTTSFSNQRSTLIYFCPKAFFGCFHGRAFSFSMPRSDSYASSVIPASLKSVRIGNRDEWKFCSNLSDPPFDLSPFAATSLTEPDLSRV